MLSESDLRPDQQAMITEMYERDRLYCVMPMGAGKTVTTLTAFNELRDDGILRRGFVIAPPLVAATVWPREAAKWEHLANRVTVEHLGGPPAHRLARLAESDADLFSISDALTQWLEGYLRELPDEHPLLDFLTYDEPKLKNPRGGAIGNHLLKIGERAGSVCLLSGTPRPNGYEDLYMPMRVLSRDTLWNPKFDEWRRRNFMPLDFKGYAWEVHDFRKVQLDKDLQRYMVRAADPPRAYDDTLRTGPDFDFEIDLPDAAEKKYRTMEKDKLLKLFPEGGDPDDPAVIAALSQAVVSSKLAQIAQGFIYGEDEDERIAHRLHEAKTAALETMLDSAGAEKVVVVYGFRDDAMAIEDLLRKTGRSFGVLGGGTTASRRIKLVDQWNEKRLDVLLMHPASAGHGVELQFGGRRMIWYCPTWSTEQYDQTIKRLDRPGQDLMVYNHQIIARKTIDIVKRNRVQFRMTDQEAFKSLLRVAA